MSGMLSDTLPTSLYNQVETKMGMLKWICELGCRIKIRRIACSLKDCKRGGVWGGMVSRERRVELCKESEDLLSIRGEANYKRQL